MRFKIVEATSMKNWGKFLLITYDGADFEYESEVDTGRSLLGAIGDHNRAVWVMDLQTGEGARFYPSVNGFPTLDLDKHAIWVCPLFQPFLEWLYRNAIDGRSDLNDIPALVELPNVPFAFRGYRRPGPGKSRRGGSVNDDT